MNIKYIILAIIIITIFLVIIMIIKPEWFFSSNKHISKNGDMTLNKFGSVELIDDGIITQERPRPPPPHTQATLQPQVRTQPLHTQARPHPQTQARPQRVTQARITMPATQATQAVQAVQAVQAMLPATQAEFNNIFEMIFNDVNINRNYVDNLNFIHHINDHNNVHTIILNENMDALDNQIMEILGIHRNNLINNRQQEALQNTNTREEAIDNYINIATRQTNDTQNVHDHTVLAGFKLILNKLLQDRASNDLKTLNEIKDEINKNGRKYSNNRPHVTLKALEVIDKMENNEQIMAFEINGESITDAICLQLVWNRAEHPENQKNKELLKQSIFDNLVDCWEKDLFGNDYIVCVTGRSTRVLSSLTLLDFDETNWNVKKFEEFKNDIFNKVKTIIIENAKIATNNNDIDIQNAGKAYLATTAAELNAINTPSDAATLELNTKIKQDISNMITNYVNELEVEYNTIIPEYMKKSVEIEAISSIDMF